MIKNLTERLPNWSRLWDDITQEENRKGSQVGQSSEDVEQNVALATKANKKKKDMSQVKCYQCG